MSDSPSLVSFIGFGEAGAAFAGPMNSPLRAYDRKGLDTKRADYAAAGVDGTASNAAAASGASLLLSLVTADQALAAAEESAASISSGAIYCDGNSVAPATKAAAAATIERAGGHYVDVAVMAPVHPLQLAVPLLLAGERASEARDALVDLGFTSVAIVGARVGQAAAIKMIRSVMIKGIEALSFELAEAAEAADVRAAVISSLDASWTPHLGWTDRIDGAIERMARHGLRRAAEMDEVAATLAALGVDNRMARATAGKQRAAASTRRERAA